MSAHTYLCKLCGETVSESMDAHNAKHTAVKYDILSAGTAADLILLVNEKLAEGYTLVGGLFISTHDYEDRNGHSESSDWFFQAVTGPM